MVYRGKPSAGCENCRKAKKRCGLEQPACQRCVKLKKTCSGYRDTTALQIQDETSAVKRKAERQKARTQTTPSTLSPSPTPVRTPVQTKSLSPPGVDIVGGILTPGSTSSDSTSSSDSTIDLDMFDADPTDALNYEYDWNAMGLTVPLRPKPDDVATNYFLSLFTSNSHWDFIRSFAASGTMDPCLSLAIRACGMAALDNVQNVTMGRDYARSMYVEALGLLNQALRDPKQSKTDESLVAVSMLGYYENLTCEGRQSIQSWKAHVRGATQLLRLRGKAQFKTQIGRIMFRELRAQIMISCLWDDQMPPDFLWDYEKELEYYTIDHTVTKPVDKLVSLCFDFAVLRAKMFKRTIPDKEAAEVASELERKFIQWQIDTMAHSERWRYYEIEVADSEHVWDGRVHALSGHPAIGTWNTYRSIRIMLSRTQEMLCRKFSFTDEEREEQMLYFRKTRRQMTDEICLAVPAALGHASPATNSPCVLITAYASIWPLFFAGTCALERTGSGAWSILKGEALPPGQTASAAAAQATWIMGRLDYISQSVGLRWADGVAATLRGDFMVPHKLLEDTDRANISKFVNMERPRWVKEVEKAHRGPRYLIETPSPLSDALAEESAKSTEPIWLGRAVGKDTQAINSPHDPLRGFSV